MCVFFVDEGREDPNITKSRPLLARQRDAFFMAFRWCADDGPQLNAGLVEKFRKFKVANKYGQTDRIQQTYSPMNWSLTRRGLIMMILKP